MDRASDSIEERCRTSDVILLVCHGFYLIERNPVMQDLRLIIEEYGRDQHLALFFLLLCDHGVVAAYCIVLKASHGSAPVQDEYDLCQSLSHVLILSFCRRAAFEVKVSICVLKGVVVACEATFRDRVLLSELGLTVFEQGKVDRHHVVDFVVDKILNDKVELV